MPSIRSSPFSGSGRRLLARRNSVDVVTSHLEARALPVEPDVPSPWNGEAEGDRLEDARPLLDDVTRRAAEDRERVDRRDDRGDEGHPQHRLEEPEEPERDQRQGGELREVRQDVEARDLAQDGQHAECGSGEAEPLGPPEREHEPDDPEDRRDEHDAEEHDLPPEGHVRQRCRDRVVDREHRQKRHEPGASRRL